MTRGGCCRPSRSVTCERWGTWTRTCGSPGWRTSRRCRARTSRSSAPWCSVPPGGCGCRDGGAGCRSPWPWQASSRSCSRGPASSAPPSWGRSGWSASWPAAPLARCRRWPARSSCCSWSTRGSHATSASCSRSSPPPGSPHSLDPSPHGGSGARIGRWPSPWRSRSLLRPSAPRSCWCSPRPSRPMRCSRTSPPLRRSPRPPCSGSWPPCSRLCGPVSPAGRQRSPGRAAGGSRPSRARAPPCPARRFRGPAERSASRC